MAFIPIGISGFVSSAVIRIALQHQSVPDKLQSFAASRAIIFVPWRL